MDDDDDIPLAFVVKPLVTPSSQDEGNVKSKDAKKNVEKNQGKEKKGKDPKAGKQIKQKSSSEWEDLDYLSRPVVLRKQKSFLDWARSNSTLLLFLGSVILIVSCR